MSEPTRLAVEAIGQWLLGWTLVVLGVASWIVLARPWRASVRHAGWLLATFAGLLLAPLVLAVGPRTSWRELLRLDPKRTFDVEATAPASPSWFGGESAAAVATSPSARVDEPPAFGPVTPAAPLPPPEPRAQAAPNRWPALLLGVWAAGFSAFAGRLMWSVFRVRRLLTEANDAPPEGLADELETARGELRIRRRVRLAVHPGIAAPMCVGLLRPVILWPSSANCPMSPRQRRASLVHELAHLRHGDDGIALAAEAWRAATWFYPLVHLTVLRLRAEREYRCDDLAAATLDAPERYAEWLLDLAPVRVGEAPPLLASSLLGQSNLAARVARILRGETRWAGPPGRRARVVLTLAGLLVLASAGSLRLVGFTASAAQQPADAPLPELTPAQLAAKIREAMARYDDRGTIRVLFTDTRNLNFLRSEEPDWVSYRGRARHESDGTRWRAEYDSVMPNSRVDRNTPRTSPDRWSTGFDGEKAYDFQVTRNRLHLGVANSGAHRWTPRSLIWDESQQLTETLEGIQKSEVSVSQRVVDGTNCYVVRSRSTSSPDYGGEWVVAPRWGYLPISRKWLHKGRAYSIHIAQDVHEVTRGIWAPRRIEEESYNVSGDGPPRLDSRRRIQVVEYRPEAIPPAETFRLTIPFGVDVVDLPDASSYQNDPWWPDVAPMLREKYGWPKPGFWWLKMLGSSLERELDGQPAPPLRFRQWVNTKPLDLASLRGKVTLVEFGTIHDSHYAPRYAAALRELYATYHPVGLEILSLQPPRADVAEIRRFAKDYRIPYPMVLDDDRSAPAGDTAKAFAIRGRICAVFIDHEGKVRSAGTSTQDGGRVVETVVSLLHEAGARDVKPVSLEMPRLPDPALTDAEKLFQAKAEEALKAGPEGKVVGRVVDEKGRPIAAATIRGTLEFSMLMFAEPGGYYLSTFRRPAGPFTAETDRDGRFELSGLCKGGYLVKVNAPGRAWVERTVYLGPDLAPARVELKLTQGDTIAGVVRDPQGKPVAGATVTPEGRQHFDDDHLRFTTRPSLKAVTTDSEGRFRFSGLQEGRYLLKVEAKGFKTKEPDAIPCGDENVAVTLEP